MSKSIIVVTGSTRANGNSDAVAQAFIEGAKESGNIVTKFDVGRMNVLGCKGCEYCLAHEGKCVQKDDMQEIYEALHKADMLVFVTPIYWYGFTSQLKAMIDRLFAHFGKAFSITSTALLVVYGDKDTTVVEPIISQYKSIIGLLGWEDKGILTEGEINGKGDAKDKKIIVEAKNLGLVI